LTSDNDTILQLNLKLLKNLCPDPDFRLLLSHTQMVSKLLSDSLLNDPTLRSLSLQVLYWISVDAIGIVEMAQPQSIARLLRFIFESKQEAIPLDVGALMINLSTHKLCASVMCEESGLKFIVKKALKTNDVLLLKLLRNLASHQAPLILPFLVRMTIQFIAIGTH
jgi:hypothetical protein